MDPLEKIRKRKVSPNSPAFKEGIERRSIAATNRDVMNGCFGAHTLNAIEEYEEKMSQPSVDAGERYRGLGRTPEDINYSQTILMRPVSGPKWAGVPATKPP